MVNIELDDDKEYQLDDEGDNFDDYGSVTMKCNDDREQNS